MTIGMEVLCPSLKKMKRGPKDDCYIVYQNNGMPNLKSKCTHIYIRGNESVNKIADEFNSAKSKKDGYCLILVIRVCIKVGEDPVIFKAYQTITSRVRSISVVGPLYLHVHHGIPSEQVMT